MGTILSFTHLTMRFGQRSVIKTLCSELHVDLFVGAEVVFNPQSASLTGQPYAMNSALALGRQSDLHTLEESGAVQCSERPRFQRSTFGSAAEWKQNGR